MKYIISLILTVAGLTSSAQRLTFSEKGRFRIAQFTDTHVDLGSDERRSESQKTVAQLEYILQTEQPNLVVFTGDVVTGKPAAAGWRMILDPLKKAKIPFIVVLGNHDREQDLSSREIGAIVSEYPNNLTLLTKGQLADCVVAVADPTGKKTEALLYCMDSNDYSTVKELEGYGWFTFDQIGWYRSLSHRYTEKNGGKPLPALAFFHIPLPEYIESARATTEEMIGQRTEDECPGILNTGMFAAFVECGDVFGIFTGHDHDNDYLFTKQGIALTYGRFSGYKTTYTDLKQGVRIIELKRGERSFDTWIRERNGAQVDLVTCNGRKYIKH